MNLNLNQRRRVGDEDRTLCGDIMYVKDSGEPARRLCGGCSSLVDVTDESDRIIGSRMQQPEGCGDLLERSAP